jgi:hypothetical protein
VKSERGRETGWPCVAPRNHDKSFLTQDELDSAGLVGESKSSNDLEQVLRTLATASYSLDRSLSTAERYHILPNPNRYVFVSLDGKIHTSYFGPRDMLRGG